MDSEKSNRKFAQILEKGTLSLPSFPKGLEAAFKKGQTFAVNGTNVVRVPFGIRQPRKQRPPKPERLTTLVIPLQPQGSPTPPPQAA